MIKKILHTILFTLVLSGGASAKVIELEKCNRGENKYDSNVYEKRSYIVDTSKATVQRVTVYTDKEYKKLEKEFMQEFGNTKGLSKISTFDYKIEYADKRFVKAEKKWKDIDGTIIISTIEIDLKKEIVYSKMHQNSRRVSHQCK